ncbi:hypothetical protein E2C01_037097 [Portunus trituberculatus]|uniref:Uncharacterized protein n=1 Tax=Portunus trituberculatus TaxID=210409 RepID=A0A5B7FE26_PORTR|nr:hypothetical protein [Portunus trituberculatus]
MLGAAPHVLLYIHGQEGELCHFLFAPNLRNREEIRRHSVEEEWSLQKVHKKPGSRRIGAAGACMAETSRRRGIGIMRKGHVPEERIET